MVKHKELLWMDSNDNVVKKNGQVIRVDNSQKIFVSYNKHRKDA